MNRGLELVNQLIQNHELSKELYAELLTYQGDAAVRECLRAEAVRSRKEYYGDKVFIRGLIEFTNFCKNNCYYCGIRGGNKEASRYRMTEEEILSCCANGYELGFRTFVLQGGEDPWFTDDRIVNLVRRIKAEYPDCAITLSVGEKSRESYRRYKEAGADRYLLRHETANEAHYRLLHPENLSLAVRKQCLRDLKELGYQIGAGFMVGSPGQNLELIAEDLVYLKELQPHMVGIGPFIPHHDTCFAKEPAGTVDQTLFLLSIIRIILPKVLLPATTALGTLDPVGREKGLMAGANVVMPNLSPMENRKNYALYDNKINAGDDARVGLEEMRKRVEDAGYRMVVERGDAL